MTEMMKNEKEIKLAENLKKLMAAKKISVSTTAKQVRMHKSTLHNYCHGVLPRNLLKIKELADFFGVPFSELVFGAQTSDQKLTTGDGIEGRYEVTVKRVKGELVK